MRPLPPRSGDRRARAGFTDGQPAAVALPVPGHGAGTVASAGAVAFPGRGVPADAVRAGGVVCADVMRAGDGVLASGEASSQAVAAMTPKPGIARVAAQAAARWR